MSWPKVALGEVVDIKGGGTPSRDIESYWNGGIPWASVKDFKSASISRTLENISKEGLSKSASNLIQKGTVLIPTRMALGKVAINTVDCAINQDIKALSPRTDKLHVRYLLHFLLGQADFIERNGTGATVKGIKLDFVKSLQIPLPPLDEQKRIAAILDKADELRRLRRRAIDRLDTLAQSIFYDMFGGYFVGSRVELGEVMKFRYGTSEKSAQNGVPTLRIPNIVGDTINVADLKFTPVNPAELDRLRLEQGDLLFVRTNGNPDYVGRCAAFDKRLVGIQNLGNQDWVFASYLIRGRLQTDRLRAQFLEHYLRTQIARRDIKERSKTSAGQYNINTQGLGSLKVPIPPIGLQNEFVHIASAIVGRRSRYEQSEKSIESLFASLQQRAFRGEL